MPEPIDAPQAAQAKSSIPANLYIGSMIAVGSAVLLYSALNWRLDAPVTFYVLLAAGVIVAHWKVRLPIVGGTMSVACILAFFAASTLNLAEAVIVLSASALSQCTWRARRVRLVQVAFNVSAMAVAMLVIAILYRLKVFGDWHIPSSVRLMIVAPIYFIFNTVPIAAVISLTQFRPFWKTWATAYRWSFPFYLVGAGLAAIMRTAIRNVGWQAAVVTIPILYFLYRSYELFIDRLERDRKHAQQISELHFQTVEALALAIEAKDQTTGSHLARVQVYALEIGKALGMSAQELDGLRAASLLHDIGKLAVPEYIISKPGKLTRDEFDKMKIHPVVGAEILERVDFPYPVTPLVRSHHEKWNGEGYPDGLKGEAIPLGARILAAVDTLDALCSDRQYRKALPIDDAMAIVLAESGKSFDPNVVDVLSRNFRQLEQKARMVELENRHAVLSVGMRVERGAAPAAGFENTAVPTQTVSKPVNFIASAASAREEMHSLWELIRNPGASISLRDALSIFSARLKDLVPYDSLTVFTLQGDLLKPQYVAGENSRFFSALEIPMGMGLSGWVAENVKSIINGNPEVESGHVQNPTQFTTMGSALSTPLEVGDRVIGVLTLYLSDKDAFSQENLHVLVSLAPKLALAIEACQRFEPAEISGSTDSITELPNARSLFIYLDSEIARSGKNANFCVVAGNLDGFRRVNDQLGYLAGNQVLRKVANVLSSGCLLSGYVARVGGDDFVLILPAMNDVLLQAQLGELRAAVTSIGFQLSISFGVALFGKDGSDPDRLLARAEQNMYKAKRRRASPIHDLVSLKRRA